MTAQSRRRLKGHSFLKDPDAHTEIASSVELELAVDEVVQRIGPVGDIDAGRSVRSRHPAVVRYMGETIKAHQAHEHRMGPPRPVPKARPDHPKPLRPVTCAQCGGSGWIPAEDDNWKDCPDCNQ